MSEVLINELDINEGTNYRVRRIAHDDSPPMRMSTLEIARRDGEELVAASFGPKRIEIEGTVKASTHNGLIEKIDELKKYCLKDDLVDLDIPYGATTRRYQVQVTNVFIGDESFNVTFVPFTIVCEAIEEPYGRETTWSEALSVNALTNQFESLSPTFEGSAHPVPKMTFTINTAGNLEGIHVYNKNTDTRLETFTGYADNDQLDIDNDERIVYLNEDTFSFEGVFPEFEVGENKIGVDFITADSISISQEQKNDEFSVWKHKYTAQAIQPAANIDVPKIEVYMKHYTKRRTATPDGITLRLETDSAGEPSGTLVDANAEVTIPYTSSTDNQWYWYVFNFDSLISLTSGTDYWIVMKEDWTGASRSSYRIGRMERNVYTDTSYTYDTLWSFDWGSTWVNSINADKRGVSDMTFRVWSDQTADVNWDVGVNIDYKKRYF